MTKNEQRYSTPNYHLHQETEHSLLEDIGDLKFKWNLHCLAIPPNIDTWRKPSMFGQQTATKLSELMPWGSRDPHSIWQSAVYLGHWLHKHGRFIPASNLFT